MRKSILVIVFLLLGFLAFAGGGQEQPEDNTYVGAAPMPGAFGVPLANSNYQGGSYDSTENQPKTYDEKEIIAVIGNYNVPVSQRENASLTISISNPSGMYFVSQSNPAFKRPFEVQLSFSSTYTKTDNSYLAHLRYNEPRLSESNPTFTTTIKEIFEKNNETLLSEDIRRYGIWCDVVLILPGTVDPDTDTLKAPNSQGVEVSYPLVPADDYTAMVTISYIYSDGNTENTRTGEITIPFSGYYDRTDNKVRENTVNMYVNPNANAARLSIERDHSTWVDVGLVEMRSISYKRMEIDENKNEIIIPVGSKGVPKIFASSSRNPYALNPEKFVLLHDSVTINTPVNSMNSIGYKVRLTDLDNNSHVEFDGTDSVKSTMTDDESSNANWISVSEIKIESPPEAKYYEYNLFDYSGRIEVMIDDPGSIVMAPGRYTGNVYLHLVMEE